MAFKLIEWAQAHWWMVNALHLVALIGAGATLVNGNTSSYPTTKISTAVVTKEQHETRQSTRLDYSSSPRPRF